MSEATRYVAFISYSHADERVASWLHKSIETYAVPKRLIGQDSPLGPTPSRLKPLFRDRDELASSADLSTSIKQALEESAFLIVLCSPNAVKSKWVNEEILAFQQMGRSDRILALIVDGEPAESFPEALQTAEPIAADLRPTGDGKRSALLKILAGLLGVGFDDLRQRDLHRRQRRMAVALATSFAITAITAGLAVFAVLKSREAVRERNRAEDNFLKSEENFKQARQAVQDFFVKLGDKELDRVDGVVNLRIILLKMADTYYTQFMASRPSDRDLATERQNILMALATQYQAAGQDDQARDIVQSLLESQEKRAQDAPDDVANLRLLASSYDRLAHQKARQKKFDEAAEFRTKTIEIRERLVQLNPSSTLDLLELSTAYDKLGLQLASGGNSSEAAAALEKSLNVRKRLMELDQSTEESLRNVALTQYKLAEIYKQAGRSDKAIDLDLKALAAFESLYKSNNKDLEIYKLLAATYGKLGELYASQGQTELARPMNLRGIASLERLVQLTPDDADNMKLLAMKYAYESERFVRERKIEQAMAMRQKSLTIMEQIVQDNPRNIDYLRLLATGYSLQTDLYRGAAMSEKTAEMTNKKQDIDTRLARLQPGSVPEKVNYRAPAYGRQPEQHATAGKTDEAFAVNKSDTATVKIKPLSDPQDTSGPAPETVIAPVLASTGTSSNDVSRAELDVTDAAAIVAMTGRMVTVKGTVDAAAWSPSRRVFFVNFRGVERGGFAVNIFADDYQSIADALGGDVAMTLANKQIRVTGQITAYQGRPRIAVDQASQISILGPAEGNTSVSVAVPAVAAAAGSSTKVYDATNTIALAASVGQLARVQGVVDRIDWAASGKIAFMRFRGCGRNDFVIKIFRANFDVLIVAFKGQLEPIFVNKEIRITGKIGLYGDRPEMSLDRADQIEFVGGANEPTKPAE